jgi:hypothetical protein
MVKVTTWPVALRTSLEASQGFDSWAFSEFHKMSGWNDSALSDIWVPVDWLSAGLKLLVKICPTFDSSVSIAPEAAPPSVAGTTTLPTTAHPAAMVAMMNRFM